MRNAEVGTRNRWADARADVPRFAFPLPRSAILALLIVLTAPRLSSAQSLPPLPDTGGFGVHVLALARAPDGAVWVGTYGQGIYVLRPAAGTWEHIGKSADTTAHSISWDFVHAFGFGPLGAIWYGTVGNGWGLSSDGGKTWTNWEVTQLGPEWQYVAPHGIVTPGDTGYVATADRDTLSRGRRAARAGVPRPARRAACGWTDGGARTAAAGRSSRSAAPTFRPSSGWTARHTATCTPLRRGGCSATMTPSASVIRSRWPRRSCPSRPDGTPWVAPQASPAAASTRG